MTNINCKQTGDQKYSLRACWWTEMFMLNIHCSVYHFWSLACIWWLVTWYFWSPACFCVQWIFLLISMLLWLVCHAYFIDSLFLVDISSMHAFGGVSIGHQHISVPPECFQHRYFWPPACSQCIFLVTSLLSVDIYISGHSWVCFQWIFLVISCVVCFQWSWACFHG